MAATAAAPRVYLRPLVGPLDPPLRRCLAVASVLGAAVLLVALVAPLPPELSTSVDDLPERYARLILEKPAPPAPVPAPAPEVAMERPVTVPEAQPQPVAKPRPAPPPRPAPRRRAEEPRVAPDAGTQGRAKAETEVAANLQQATASLDAALGDLAAALPAAGQGDEQAEARRPQRRRGATRGGRRGAQLAQVAGATDLARAEPGGSGLEGGGVAIAAVEDLQVADVAAADAGGAPGNAVATAGRSSESLLAVVRRYAPGIQFCYENALKKDPSLRGKLVVRLTVQPDGSVRDVAVVEDTLGSAEVASCAVAQMEGWRFGPAAGGASTFQAPFVFTPPDS